MTSSRRTRYQWRRPSLAAIDEIKTEAIAICMTTDMRPLEGAAGFLDWRLLGRLSHLIEQGTMTGADGECILLTSDDKIIPKRIFVFGFGDAASLQENPIKRMRALALSLKSAQVTSVALTLPEPAHPLYGLVESCIVPILGDALTDVFLGEEEAL